MMLSRLAKHSKVFTNTRFFATLADVDQSTATVLPKNTNQVQGLAKFAYDFLDGKLGNGPDSTVLDRVEKFHTDSVLCGLSALALRCNAPTVLREEALEYPANSNTATGMTGGGRVFGSDTLVCPEKSVVANSCAVREWDSNGTVFGYRSDLGTEFQAGEFGHNDYYPVCVAAAQQCGLSGEYLLRSMLLHDEIRGRLAEVFSLKSYKIDHVVHGAIATAVVYGAMMGATLQQIESAVGMVVAHYIPFRAIRAGHQLSDSKGASAAISSEVAILSVDRAMRGFIGPADIFRNPQAIFRLFEPTKSDDESPFDLILSHSGTDFSVMGMHFKLGLYEHQSAGAIQALIDAIRKNPDIIASGDPNSLESVSITIYEPAFGIIGDPAKRNPTTRQSADHSMVYIISSILRKAYEIGSENLKQLNGDNNLFFKALMLLPFDYSDAALFDGVTRNIMKKIEFKHGGSEYDKNYPNGIPTRLSIKTNSGEYESDLVMFPSGHARNTTCDLNGILDHKFVELGKIALQTNDKNKIQTQIIDRLSNLKGKSNSEVQDLYNIPYQLANTIGF